MFGTVACPMVEAWNLNRINIKREIRVLRQNLKICGACENAHGACQKMDCVRAEINIAMSEVLAELGLQK
jgi:hypothetical protein